MSSDDLYVTERTDLEIEEIALAARDVLGFGNQPCPDLLSALENELPKYLPQFGLIPVADGSLGPKRIARASYNPHKIEIVNSSYKNLGEFDRNTRFDVAHELGHFFLHYDGKGSLPKYRTMGNVVIVRRQSMSGELQANKFARGLLVPADVACQFDTWEEIVEWCKVPCEVAQEAYRLYGRRSSRVVHPKLKAILDDLTP